MIESKKQRNALAALNAVLVLARSFAYGGECAEVADVLDVAEYLPMLMLDSADRTADFREQLVGLAKKWPQFAVAVERFDGSM